MWDSLLLAILFEKSKIISLGFSQAYIYMVPVIEGIYRMSWPDCSVGGTCHGALGETLMSLVYPN